MQKVADKKKNALQCDGGYGLATNIIREWYLTLLTDENKKLYINKLKKEDREKYDEFENNLIGL